jgi:hypothetical protein
MSSHECLGYLVFVIDDGVVLENTFPLHDTGEAVRTMNTILDEERHLDFDLRSGRPPDPETEARYAALREEAGRLRSVELGPGRKLHIVSVTGPIPSIQEENHHDSNIDPGR